MDTIKNLKLLHVKGHYQECKKTTEWEEIFANHIPDKIECPEYIRNFHNSKIKTLITQFKISKWGFGFSFIQRSYRNGQEAY